MQTRSSTLIYGLSVESICLNGPKCRLHSSCPYNHPRWGKDICLYHLKKPGSCKFSRNCKNGDHARWGNLMYHSAVTQRTSQQLFPKRRPQNYDQQQEQKVMRIKGVLPTEICPFKQRCKFKSSCKFQHPKWAQFYCIFNFRKECINSSTSCRCGIHKDWNSLAKQMATCQKIDKEDAKKTIIEETKQSKDDDCIICFYPMGASACTKTTCDHSFHTECLEKWKKQTKTCPICRKTLVDRQSVSVVRSAAERVLRLQRIRYL